MRHELYFSAEELRESLSVLGPPGTRAEATIATAAEILASLIEYAGEDVEFGEDEVVAWQVEHYLSPEAARQAGRPHVVLERGVVDASRLCP